MTNCPCCGYRTIDDSFIPIDEICEVCYWQYDEMANRNPERVVGPNSISLNEARENYKKFGACEERFATNSQLSSDDEKINQELSNYNWMDFEISNGGMDKILLHGFLDEAEEDTLCLQFENVEYIQCRTTFTFEGNGPFLEIIDGEEAKQINMDYWITIGKKIFRLSNTNIQAPMYIVADKVEKV